MTFVSSLPKEWVHALPRFARPNLTMPYLIPPRPAITILVRMAERAEALCATVYGPCRAVPRRAAPCQTPPMHCRSLPSRTGTYT
jgi:hypothetical protein